MHSGSNRVCTCDRFFYPFVLGVFNKEIQMNKHGQYLIVNLNYFRHAQFAAQNTLTQNQSVFKKYEMAEALAVLHQGVESVYC